MMSAGALFLLGCGLTAVGIVWPDMYDVGILIAIVAAIGIVVRVGDWARVWLGRRAAADPGGPASPLGASDGELT
jgi:hypothetical protein